MNGYITVQEAAEKWGVTPRQVQILCKENHIKEDMRMSRIWIIPENANKPTGEKKAKRKKMVRDAKRRKSIRNANKKSRITKEIIEKVLEIYSGKCAYCGCECYDGYHIDHKIPLSKGGGNEIENLALSCPNCNWSKRDKTDIEFIGRKV